MKRLSRQHLLRLAYIPHNCFQSLLRKKICLKIIAHSLWQVQGSVLPNAKLANQTAKLDVPGGLLDTTHLLPSLSHVQGGSGHGRFDVISDKLPQTQCYHCRLFNHEACVFARAAIIFHT